MPIAILSVSSLIATILMFSPLDPKITESGIPIQLVSSIESGEETSQVLIKPFYPYSVSSTPTVINKGYLIDFPI